MIPIFIRPALFIRLFGKIIDKMSDSNHITLQSYEENIEEYIKQTPHKLSNDVKKWISDTINGLLLEARILEIGSGFGRDADYIEEQGYKVE